MLAIIEHSERGFYYDSLGKLVIVWQSMCIFVFLFLPFCLSSDSISHKCILMKDDTRITIKGLHTGAELQNFSCMINLIHVMKKTS